jgi:hypothetical protein
VRATPCLAGLLLSGCAASAAVAPSPDAGPTEIVLRVGLGPLVPPTYRAGVRVRAFDGARVRDLVTDATGTVRLATEATARWDLTAAEPGHAAVSLLGAGAGLATEVLLRATAGRRPAAVRDVVVTGVIRGRSAARSGVLLDGARGATVARDDAFSLTVPTWPGAPPWQLVAIELDESSAFLNGVVTPPSAPGAPLTVTLPTPPSRPRSQELRLEYPAIGRVTAERFDRVLAESVARVKYTESGVGIVPVGRSHLERPGVTSFSRWGVEAWEGDLAPELISASLRIAGVGGEAPLLAAVTTRPSFRGLAPAFAVVTSLAAYPLGAIDAVAVGWNRAAFTVTIGDVVAWEGYGLDDAPWTSRPLPPLPDGVARASLAPGPGPAVLRACVLRDLPLSAPAWTSPLPALPLRNLLTVCEEGGATLASP